MHIFVAQTTKANFWPGSCIWWKTFTLKQVLFRFLFSASKHCCFVNKQPKHKAVWWLEYLSNLSSIHNILISTRYERISRFFTPCLIKHSCSINYSLNTINRGWCELYEWNVFNQGIDEALQLVAPVSGKSPGSSVIMQHAVVFFGCPQSWWLQMQTLLCRNYMKDDNLRSALYGSPSLLCSPSTCEMDAWRWVCVHVSLKLTARGGCGFDLIKKIWCTCTPETWMNPENTVLKHTVQKRSCKSIPAGFK